MYDLKVGQEVFTVNKGQVVSVTVLKVGRKFFYTDKGGRGRDNKFDKETLNEVNGINYGCQVYLDPQEYYDKTEKESIKKFLMRFFGDWNRPDRDNLSLEKLRQIKAIVEGER